MSSRPSSPESEILVSSRASLGDTLGVKPRGPRPISLKETLDTDHIGFTILELDPNENAPEHSHEVQEEIYYVEEGAVDVAVNGETVHLTAGEVIKLDPEDTRQVRNRDRASRLVLVGAPRDAP